MHVLHAGKRPPVLLDRSECPLGTRPGDPCRPRSRLCGFNTRACSHRDFFFASDSIREVAHVLKVIECVAACTPLNSVTIGASIIGPT